MKSIAVKSLSLLFSLCLFSCSANLNNQSVKAQAGAPESTEIEVVSLPYNPQLPTYVVAVEPFVFSRTFADGEGYTINIRSGGEDLAAQLVTVLSNNGNISVIDSGLAKDQNGMYKANLRSGEMGPYIVRATVTEFTEVAEAESNKKGGSLGWLGAVAGIAGAVSGKDGLMWGGAGLAAANPTYRNNQSAKKGMVALDIRLVDGNTGRIVSAFKSSGTFASASATSGFSLFGIGNEQHKFAQSVIGQAIRAALNDASLKINKALTSRNI